MNLEMQLEKTIPLYMKDFKVAHFGVKRKYYFDYCKPDFVDNFKDESYFWIGLLDMMMFALTFPAKIQQNKFDREFNQYTKLVGTSLGIKAEYDCGLCSITDDINLVSLKSASEFTISVWKNRQVKKKKGKLLFQLFAAIIHYFRSDLKIDEREKFSTEKFDYFISVIDSDSLLEKVMIEGYDVLLNKQSVIYIENKEIEQKTTGNTTIIDINNHFNKQISSFALSELGSSNSIMTFDVNISDMNNEDLSNLIENPFLSQRSEYESQSQINDDLTVDCDYYDQNTEIYTEICLFSEEDCYSLDLLDYQNIENIEKEKDEQSYKRKKYV